MKLAAAERARMRLLAEEMTDLACEALAPEDVEQVKRLLLDHAGVARRGERTGGLAFAAGGWTTMADDGAKSVVRQFLAAIKGGDGQTMMSLLAEDAVVVLPGSFKVAWAGRWQGREPIKQCFLAIGALLDIRDHTVNLMFGEGEHVMVLIDETSAAKNTGRLLHQETAWYFRIVDGAIVHWQAYEDTEQIAWVWDEGG